MQLPTPVVCGLKKAADSLNEALESDRIDINSRNELQLAVAHIAVVLGDPNVMQCSGETAGSDEKSFQNK